ncbi:MAG: PaaI family thioesterase [Sneathiella sp.]
MTIVLKTAEQALAFIQDALPAIDHHGEEFSRIEPGKIEMRVPYRDDNYKNGVFSGPLTMGLCDTAMYVTAYTLEDSEGRAVMADFNIQFKALIPEGDIVILTEADVRKGRSIPLSAKVMNAEKTTVYCTCTSRYVLINQGSR